MRRRTSLVPVVCSVVFAIAGIGCTTTGPVPTTQNSSKFVHAESDGASDQQQEDRARQADNSGKVTGSIGITGVSTAPDGADESQISLIAFPAEASFTSYMGDKYDLAISAGNTLANVTGNLWFIDNGFQIGFLHGIGLGYEGQEQGAGDAQYMSHSIRGNLTGGVFVQASEAEGGTLFGAGRYTYGPEILGNTGDNAPELEETWRDAHFITANLGYTLVAGRTFVSPELAGTYGRYFDADTDQFLVTLGVSISSAY